MENLNTNELLLRNVILLSQYPYKYYTDLKYTNSKLVKDVKFLQDSNKNLRKRNYELMNELDQEKDKNNPPKKKQKNEYKIKKYKKTKLSFNNNNIKIILENIKSINDIIKLKDKWIQIRHNNKLQKLYNLIPALEKLNNMIGLNDIKEQIFKKIIYYISNPHNDEYLHTILSGPPGVGKTELAKIYSDIFVRLGILKNSSFIEVKKDDLVGKYLGHTVPKTRELLEKALGGVVFIDEAYSLGSSRNDSFAKEAIDIINQYLSEKKNDFMMIIAGYKNELDKCFFSYNPGLKRRFSTHYEISGYNHKELLEIFKLKVSNYNYILKVDDNKLLEFFKKNHKKFKYYGGDIEKLVNELKYVQCFRKFYEDNNNKNIIFDDIKKSYIEFDKSLNEIDDEPPFGLYL